jgi:hypothetical protein
MIYKNTKSGEFIKKPAKELYDREREIDQQVVELNKILKLSLHMAVNHNLTLTEEKLREIILICTKMSTLSKIKTHKNNFLQGYVCAVVVLINLNGEVDTRTREMFRNGVGALTLSALKKSGVDEYDLSILKQYWACLH